jgi:hypothetical protein
MCSHVCARLMNGATTAERTTAWNLSTLPKNRVALLLREIPPHLGVMLLVRICALRNLTQEGTFGAFASNRSYWRTL